MCYDLNSFLIIFLILVVSIDNHYSQVTKCSTIPQLSNTAEIILQNTDVTISNDLLKSCPSDTNRLLIRSFSSNISRSLSWDVVSSPILQSLTELQVSVPLLSILYTPTHANCSSRLLSLSISGCGVTRLPNFGAFYCLKSLRILNASHNLLKELPVDLFSHAIDLSNVDLSYNKLSILPPVPQNTRTNINIEGNPIICSCLNAWISRLATFVGLPVCSWPPPCNPELKVEVKPDSSSGTYHNESFLSVLTGQKASFICNVTSSLPVVTYWSSPIGNFILPLESESEGKSYSYNFQPLLQTTTVHITKRFGVSSLLVIDNSRGHLSGNWSCFCRSSIDFVGATTELRVYSSFYHQNVYYISLCYGYGGMLFLLITGIIGGTIRYCSETHCLRRPQPPFAYEGKTLLGVIPVPEVDSDNSHKHKGANHIFGARSEKPTLYDQCSTCFNPRTHWFCASCNSIHFVEEVHEIEQDNVPSNVGEVPLGELAPDGEIIIVDHRKPKNNHTGNSCEKEMVELHRPLMNCPAVSSHNPANAIPETNENRQCTPIDPDVIVRSGNCELRVRLDPSYLPCNDPFKGSDSNMSINGLQCLRCIHRPGNVDVKLVVSNEKLAEEYREALEGLAQAVENPDPAHFRERLEEFRSRLRRDVGHGVKVLRGEFQDLRAKSARSVANLRNQSSAAAQRMRAGLSYGVEQVKDGMRSMVELCGAAGTIGQTISVVSVYTDETDRTKKEKHISAFVF